MKLSTSMLPSTLLEFTLLRISGTNTPARNILGVQRAVRRLSTARYMHQEALAATPSPHWSYDYPVASGHSRESRGRSASQDESAVAVRPGHTVSDPASELARRVKALELAAEVETSTLDPPNYTEEDLMSFYEDLLALPTQPTHQNNEMHVAPLHSSVLQDGETRPDSETTITNAMALLANEGDVAGLETLMSTQITTYPTERQRHLHIKAHLVATPSESIPTSALELLHSYEAQSCPAPIHTYTSVITSLFSSKSSLGRAQGWDLFAHMRYVAHPDPDVPLYTLMIRACASPINARPSEPEKALDLWTEMTVDRRLAPTAGAYDAIILACARSGSKTYVNEAFRLAKQMLDSYRDAHGQSAFSPSRRTFCALLEGAKRIGDLARARWILAEMTSDRLRTDGTLDPEGVNEEVMMHVFHTYASYRPPFQRTTVRSVETSDHALDNSSSEIEVSESERATNIVEPPRTPSFTHIPPQSHSEVIHEVETLFNRILADTNKTPNSPIDDGVLPADQKFKDVLLTPRLLNSYLSVHYKHSSLETSRDRYRTLFDECGVAQTARTYLEALERCAIARRGYERTVAIQFAEEVWPQWQALEDSGVDGGRPLSGRTIEKAHIAMIRILALTGNVDRAVHHVRAFAARYPPSDIRTPGRKPALRATRTVLVGQRPLVRMTSNVEVPDDHVPPLLMFDDVEILHHRLVAMKAKSEIGYLLYLCKSYEWALRSRRDAAMKTKPDPPDSTQLSIPFPEQK